MGVDEIIGAAIGLVFLFVIGAVFANVLWTISPLFAIVFVVVVFIMAIGIIRSVLR